MTPTILLLIFGALGAVLFVALFDAKPRALAILGAVVFGAAVLVLLEHLPGVR